MSAENNKLLWISVAACVFVLGLAVAGLFLFAPRAPGGDAPATFGDTAAPKATDPQDYLNAPLPTPQASLPRTEGDIIVIYGDKPASLSPAEGSMVVQPSAADPLALSSPPPVTTTTLAPAPLPKPASAKATPAPKPAAATAKPSPAAPAGPNFWIQVGSFSSRGRADELKGVLGDKGIGAVIQVRDIDGKSWYRVRVGPYELKKEAEGWLGKVKAVPGCAEALVIQDSGKK
jgi:DedD protein